MKPAYAIRNTWYAVGLCADFPMEKLTGHVIAKRPIVLWRTKHGDVVAYDDRCSHKRFPLSKGRLVPDGALE
jgi:phenylpropionate dioxygenase-like ring-hydroxylating dioxygenase large terminal subunit